MMTDQRKADRQWSELSIVALIIILGIVVLRNAWVGDDAYISFRTVDNFVNGYGLTWNVTERVQAFTHPLWVLLMSAFYLLTSDVYYTSIFLSLGLTLAAVVVLARRVAISTASAALAIVILISSKAFIDYSTSGLENALTHLILILFVWQLLSRTPSPRTFLVLSFIASLGMLNRMDTALLFAPALLYVFVKVPWKQGVRNGLLGFMPFLAWELFSVIYYGFPFPNTYYAKLHTGIPKSELIVQGFLYFLDTLSLDPLTLIVIVFGLVLVWISKARPQQALFGGVILYLIYIVYIGGDFMTGRFFAAPLFVSVLLIARYPLPSSKVGQWVPLLVVLVLSLSLSRPPLLSDRDCGQEGIGAYSAPSGIVDERNWYYRHTGFLLLSKDRQLPDHDWFRFGKELSCQGDTVVTNRHTGFFGYAAGPQVHIIDPYGLTDPLLGRLPTYQLTDWRIGHFRRRIPEGYVESQREKENLIGDSCLALYYDKILAITRGPVWSWNRLTTIVAINCGSYNNWLTCYSSPPGIVVNYRDLGEIKPAGTPWNLPDNVVIPASSHLLVEWDSVMFANRLELSLDHNDVYLLVFKRDDDELADLRIEDIRIDGGGLRVDTVQVPLAVIKSGFDRIEIHPRKGDDRYSIGHLRLDPK